MMAKKGKLYGVGLGPGDPELLTLKGLKAIEGADVIAYHQTKDRQSRALQMARAFMRDDQVKLPLVYPLTRELPPRTPAYQTAMAEFYDQITGKMAIYLNQGCQVSVIVAGDPLLYSSFLPIYQRLGKQYEIEIIPGIISATAAAARAGLPLCQGNENFTIISALLPEDELLEQLRLNATFAILKLSPRNFAKVRQCLYACGKAEQAVYIEAATLPNEKILALDEVETDNVPYFSLILVGA